MKKDFSRKIYKISGQSFFPKKKYSEKIEKKIFRKNYFSKKFTKILKIQNFFKKKILHEMILFETQNTKILTTRLLKSALRDYQSVIMKHHSSSLSWYNFSFSTFYNFRSCIETSRCSGELRSGSQGQRQQQSKIVTAITPDQLGLQKTEEIYLQDEVLVRKRFVDSCHNQLVPRL